MRPEIQAEYGPYSNSYKKMAEAFQASTQRSRDKTAVKQKAKPLAQQEADRKKLNENHRIAKINLKAKREEKRKRATASEL